MVHPGPVAYMKTMDASDHTPSLLTRGLPLVLIAVPVVALGAAFHAQFFQGLEPCPLCIYQRIPYAVILGLGVLMLIRPGAAFRRLITLIAAAAFVSGAAIAFYHVGVEQHWWGSAFCGGELPEAGISTDDLLGALNEAVEKPCDQIDWTFLGLSMATYNAAGSSILALALVIAARLLTRKA